VVRSDLIDLDHAANRLAILGLHVHLEELVIEDFALGSAFDLLKGAEQVAIADELGTIAVYGLGEPYQEPPPVRPHGLDLDRRSERVRAVARLVSQMQDHPGSERALGAVRQRPNEDLSLGAVRLVDVPHDQERWLVVVHDKSPTD